MAASGQVNKHWTAIRRAVRNATFLTSRLALDKELRTLCLGLGMERRIRLATTAESSIGMRCVFESPLDETAILMEAGGGMRVSARWRASSARWCGRVKLYGAWGAVFCVGEREKIIYWHVFLYLSIDITAPYIHCCILPNYRVIRYHLNDFGRRLWRGLMPFLPILN